MSIANRTLHLTEQTEHLGRAHGIDMFFRSMAHDLKELAIGVILSGTGTDGSLGAKSIKAELGMVMVEDPVTAGYDGMPRAAIAAGVADFILPPEEMANRITEYVLTSYGKRTVSRKGVNENPTALQRIFSLVRARTKHDFSGYKLSTVNRRIERRMAVNQIDAISTYVQFLREHPPEVDALEKDLLIKVTSFFRDLEAFGALKEHVRGLVERKEEGSAVRAWVPGCSSGEEAYSIAMIIQECLGELKKHCPVQVFGSDLDPDAISDARAGSYPGAIAGDVGAQRLEGFFVRNENRYQVRRELRERMVFSVQDFVGDPPFSRMDIVSARNLLMYFDAELQMRLVPVIHYALNEGGILFLGPAETVGGFTDLFSVLDKKWKIFRCHNKSNRPPAPILDRPAGRETGEPKSWPALLPARPGFTAGRSAEQMMLEALPPALLIDRDHQIIFAHGDTSKYVRLPEGKSSMGILEIIRPELHAAVAAGMQQAILDTTEVIREGLPIEHDGITELVRITFRPVTEAATYEALGQLIITFVTIPTVPAKGKKGRSSTASRVTHLEEQLESTRETLRITTEALETANEELRSANEEYQSTNEELQSTNEELVTSREELQSVNEELITVNAELQGKIAELSTVGDDMRNMLNSTGIATIFLDTDLRVQRYTPTSVEIFNLIESDIGRPLSHLTSELRPDDLPSKAKQVLDTLIPVKEHLETKEGRWLAMGIHPYRTSDNAIAGVVLSFVDFGEHQTRVALTHAQAILDTLHHPVMVLDGELKVVSANRTFYENFKVSPEETEGRLIYELGNHQWDIPELKALLEEILPNNTVIERYNVKYEFPHLGYREMMLNVRRLYDERGATHQILVAIEDVTGRGG